MRRGEVLSLPVLFNRLGASSLALELPAAPAPMPARVDVAIIGGGIIGLSIGWRLAARGLEVAVFEARQAGSGTSAAATGMLAAAAELEPGGEALLGLALESQGLWPRFPRRARSRCRTAHRLSAGGDAGRCRRAGRNRPAAVPPRAAAPCRPRHPVAARVGCPGPGTGATACDHGRPVLSCGSPGRPDPDLEGAAPRVPAPRRPSHRNLRRR